MTNFNEFPHGQLPGSLELAYLGDTVYDLYVRRRLVITGGRMKDLHRAAVEDQRHLARHVFCHVRRSGGRGAAAGIGRGGGDGAAHCGEEFARRRAAGQAQTHAIQPRADDIRDAVALFQYQRDRPGPVGLDELFCQRRETGILFYLRFIADVHDQRVIGRAALGGEDARHRRRIARIGAEAVHGLGREGDQPPVADDGAGFGQRFGCDGQYFGFHKRSFWGWCGGMCNLGVYPLSVAKADSSPGGRAGDEVRGNSEE